MLQTPDKLKALMLGDTGRESYMYDSWNYLDLLVLIVGYINMFGEPKGPLKMLRLLRAFRPLRMVNRLPGMKLVLVSLISACPALGNVCILLCSVFLIFSIIGVSLFSGKMYSCLDGESSKELCHGNFISENFLVPRVWRNPETGFGGWNFDNVGASLLTLFEIATGDSWEDIMWPMCDMPEAAGDPPILDQSRAYGLFAVIFTFVGSLFMLQLFVSVIIDSFNFSEGSGLMTERQQLFSDMLKLNQMLNPEPKPLPPPDQSLARACYDCFQDCRPLPINNLEGYLARNRVPDVNRVLDLPRFKQQLQGMKFDLNDPALQQMRPEIQSEIDKRDEELKKREEDLHLLECFTEVALKSQPLPPGCKYLVGQWFDVVVTACIIINIVFMCTTHYEQPDWWFEVQFTQNVGFLLVFIVEMSLKNIGLGIKGYWSDYFNAFDGAVVLVSIIFVFVPGGAIAGLFRIGRVFRLIRRAPQLRALMTTLVMTVPAISNVLAVMGLLFFIYAVIGVQLFGKARYGFAINYVCNFRSWQQAMLLLWRCSNGNWRLMMYDSRVEPPFCTHFIDEDGNEVNDCGDSVLSTIYFVSFQILSTFCVLNLVIAIILGAFTWCYSLEPSEITGDLLISAKHLRHCKLIWDRFDLYGTGSIDVQHLQTFLSILRFNVPNIFSKGVRDQNDQMLYRDYSSFGTNFDGSDQNEEERMNRENYCMLINNLKKYERSSALWETLEKSNISVDLGENDLCRDFDPAKMDLQDSEKHVFTASIDNGIIHATAFPWNARKSPSESDPEGLLSPDGFKEHVNESTLAETELLKVRFLSLINILVLEPMELDDHDVYMGFRCRDPFNYFIPGYFGDKLHDNDSDDLLSSKTNQYSA